MRWGFIRRLGIVLTWFFAWTLTAGIAECQWQPTRHFTVKDGLVQSQISEITQDDHGYLWIATQGGVARFDGVAFRRFGRADGLPENLAVGIASVGDRVWVASEYRGLVVWDGRSFEPFPLPSQWPDDTRLYALGSMGDGTVVLASEKGMAAWRDQAWQVIHGKAAVSFVQDGDGSLIAVSADLLRVHNDLTVSTLAAIDDGEYLMAATGNEHGLWFATDKPSLGFIRDGRIRREALKVEGVVIALLADRTGEGLWIGTERGLWRKEPGRDPTLVSLAPGREHLEVSTLFRDRENSLWVGGWGTGLFQIPPSAWTLFSPQTGFPAQSAWAFSESPDGCVWIGTTDKGVVSWCEDHWGRSIGSDQGLPSDAVFALSHDRSGDLWIGTGDGVCRWGGRALQCWDTDDGLKDDFVRDLIPRAEGGMWMATDLGLARWDGAEWTFWGRDDGLPGTMVRTLAEGRDGRLWMALDAVGVASFDGSRFSLISPEQGLPTARVWTLGLSTSGRVLAGTDAGLWIGDPDDPESGMVVGTEEGLPNMSVISVAQDLNGRYWAGTTHGISVVNPAGTVVRTFTAHEGLSDSEAAEGATWRDSRGRMWIGMAHGVTVVDPSRLQRNLVDPRVVLENVQINGRTHPDFQPVSSKASSAPLALSIDPSVSHLRFDFTAPSFTAPDLVQFRFALTCYDDGFGPPTTDRHVSFHSLPAGSYQFGVQAINNDGVPSAEPLWVDLTVHPPWFQTHWFQVSAILAAVLFGSGIVYLRNRQRLERSRWLEREVELRTKELDSANREIQEKNLQLTELSRTDPLTGLKNRRVMAEIMPVELSTLMREVIRFDPSQPMSRYHGSVFLMIDLDHFKQVNDRWGHEIGDRALVKCSQLLQQELRECDHLIRWGGEEFLLLIRGSNRDGAVQIVQRLLDRFNTCSMEDEGLAEVAIRASFGFIQLPLGTLDFQPSGEWSDLVDLVDRLMYQAKRAGRGRAFGVVWRREIRAELSEVETVQALNDDLDALPDPLELVELLPGE